MPHSAGKDSLLKYQAEKILGEISMRKKITLGTLLLCGSGLVMAETLTEVRSDSYARSTPAAEFQNTEPNKTEPKTSEATLESMTITAKKSDDPHTRTELGKLTEATPMSGATVTAEELEHLQLVNNLLELGKRVPGISMVRNMRIPDGGKLYTENRIDGMRTIATNTSVLDEIDGANIDHIDVITGPGSALYGSGSLGGTINVFTRQPTQTFKAKLSQEFGSWGFNRTQGNVGTSTEDGRFGFILNGSMMDNDGWRRNNAAANQNTAAEHKNGVALKGVIRLTDTTKINLGIDQLYYDYRWAGTLRMTKFEQDWRQSEVGSYGQTIDNYLTRSISVQQMLGDTSELKVAYARRTDVGVGAGGSGGSNNVMCDDSSALLAPLAMGTTVKCRAVNANSSSVTNTLKKSQTVLESTTVLFRKEFDLAKSTLYLGMDMFNVTTTTASYNNAYNALQAQSGYWAQGAMAATGQGSVTHEKNSTPYVHYEFSPIDKLRFHIGERFDKVTYSSDDRTAANKDSQKTFNAQILKTGVTYDLNDSHLIWGNWSESFNAPSVSTLLDSAAKGTAGNTIGASLNPENSDTYEIGLRGRFNSIGLRYDLALYQTSNKGFIVARDCTGAERTALNNVATCSVNENAGQLTARGLESVWLWEVNHWLDIGATYTLSEAYYNKYVTKTFDYSGNSYQAMPRHRLNLRVAVKPAPGWKVELEGDHLSDYYVDTANSGTYSRPDLFNLRASYRSKNWSLWMHALNITDRKYATRVGYSTIAGVSQLAASAGQGNSGTYTPLTVRAGLSYDF